MGNSICSKELVGASFTLSPMCDDFVAVILGTLEKTDTSNVWLETDDVSTTISGRLMHVFDVTKAISVYAARTGKHVSFQATYATGCPGNEETEVFLRKDEVTKNVLTVEDEALYAAAKFALYPLGGGSYMETVFSQIEQIKKYVKVTSVPYATKLEGGLVDIFKGLEKAFQASITERPNHTIMTVSVSINSPSHK